MQSLLVERRGDHCLPQGGSGRNNCSQGVPTRSQEYCQEAVAISEWSVSDNQKVSHCKGNGEEASLLHPCQEYVANTLEGQCRTSSGTD